MTVIKRITGTAIVLPADEIDTDRIVPARFLRQLTFENLGEHVFEDDRRAMEGGHPFDDPSRAGAAFLLVGENFGCGSSREHAPQAIRRWGIRAVVGKSFGEIFAGNAANIGLPCVTVDGADAVRLFEAASVATTELSLDLDAKLLSTGGRDLPVVINESQRQRFVEGRWDSLAELSSDIDAIRATAARLPYLNGWDQ